MAWHSSTDGWAGVDDRTAVMRAPRAARRPRRWPAWVLPMLGFICGALVSAAVFTIGWRHQTQQNAAAQNALAAATAHGHKLSDSLATARARIAKEQRIVAQARASLLDARAAGASVAGQTRAAEADATTVAGRAASMASTAAKIASELKTLTTYLTTTPAQQLDAGYIDSQAGYLIRQVDTLQSEGGTTATAAASFNAAIRKLARLAAALSVHA